MLLPIGLKPQFMYLDPMLVIADMIVFGTIAVSIFLMTLILQKPKKLTADKWLILWLITLMLHFVFFYFSFHHIYDDSVLVQSLGNSLPIFYAPLIYAYARSLTKGTMESKDILPIIIPIPIFFGTYFGVFHFGYFVSKGFINYIVSSAPIWVLCIGPSMALINLIFVLLLFKLVKLQEEKVKASCSFVDKLTLRWLRQWIYSFIISFILISLTIVLYDFGKFEPTLALVIVCLSMGIQLFIVGKNGIKQGSAFIDLQYHHSNKEVISKNTGSDLAKKGDNEKKYARSGLNEDQILILKKRLTYLMDVQRPHLDHGLTLSRLADMMNIPPYQLSQLINEGFGLNFFDFVNGHRVKEVKQKLGDSEYSQYSIFGIALESGFRSKATFNKSFKKFTGITPKDFKRKIIH